MGRRLDGVIAAAIRVAADAPIRFTSNSVRCQIKRSYVEDLRRELDHLGLRDDWKTLQKIIRDEEKTPGVAS
jgi:hypothetical protein